MYINFIYFTYNGSFSTKLDNNNTPFIYFKA